MRSLVERGATVTYVENIGTRLPRPSDASRVLRKVRRWARSTAAKQPPEVEARIRVDSPVVLPYQHLDAVRSMGLRTLMRRLGRRAAARRPLVVWTYLPMPVIRDFARAAGADALVYDWCDDAAAHVLSKSEKQRRRIARWEDEMVAAADVVFVASQSLLDARGSSNPNTLVVPHGSPRRQGRAQERRANGAPTVGFVGSITQWTDLELVDRLAAERPDWRFVMVGPVKTRVGALRRRGNVVFTGERPHEEIPGYLDSFDVAIIPYRITAATTAASPLKLREYLASGLPVVSVDVPEVHGFGDDVEIASDADGFLAAIERAVATGRRPAAAAAQGSWEERVEEMAGRVTEALGRRT
jgi:glycosyltransferase involved in cell wall biosynthesis